MELTNLVVIGLLALAFLLAIYQSRTNGWALSRQIGTLVFLVGAAVGLFLDDVLATDSPLVQWVEPFGVAIMLIGLSLSWIGPFEEIDRSSEL